MQVFNIYSSYLYVLQYFEKQYTLFSLPPSVPSEKSGIAYTHLTAKYIENF